MEAEAVPGSARTPVHGVAGQVDPDLRSLEGEEGADGQREALRDDVGAVCGHAAHPDLAVVPALGQREAGGDLEVGIAPSVRREDGLVADHRADLEPQRRLGVRSEKYSGGFTSWFTKDVRVTTPPEFRSTGVGSTVLMRASHTPEVELTGDLDGALRVLDPGEREVDRIHRRRVHVAARRPEVLHERRIVLADHLDGVQLGHGAHRHRCRVERRCRRGPRCRRHPSPLSEGAG